MGLSTRPLYEDVYTCVSKPTMKLLISLNSVLYNLGYMVQYISAFWESKVPALASGGTRPASAGGQVRQAWGWVYKAGAPDGKGAVW